MTASAVSFGSVMLNCGCRAQVYDLGKGGQDSILRDPGEVCMSETKAAGYQDYRLM